MSRTEPAREHEGDLIGGKVNACGGIKSEPGTAVMNQYQGITILLAAADTSGVNFVKSFVTHEGGSFYTATTGEEAFRLIEKHQVDIVIYDESVADIGVAEFARILNLAPLKNRISVVASTSGENAAANGKALQSGVIHALLPKPVQMNSLATLINLLAGKKKLRAGQ